MDKAQRIEEIRAAEVPIRKAYETAKAKRREVADQVAKLVAEEQVQIREMHQLSDQLEALRLEKRDLERPPRQLSRQRLR